MANKIQAKDIISPDVKKEIEAIEKALADLNKQLITTIETSIDLKKEMDNGAASQNETSKRVKTVNDNMDILAESEKELEKIERDYQKTLARTNAERQEQGQELARLK
ncbi:hypothetical protein KAR91_36835, partial [Candidatus Pacearchaeota archaeon]|nr:hypothetical protein [Candidatus Pacearchaeota archaeon]